MKFLSTALTLAFWVSVATSEMVHHHNEENDHHRHVAARKLGDASHAYDERLDEAVQAFEEDLLAELQLQREENRKLMGKGKGKGKGKGGPPSKGKGKGGPPSKGKGKGGPSSKGGSPPSGSKGGSKGKGGGKGDIFVGMTKSPGKGGGKGKGGRARALEGKENHHQHDSTAKVLEDLVKSFEQSQAERVLSSKAGKKEAPSIGKKGA
uniref:Uncharacterized protein n=1 Tax=Entomoneis paludosa TaxID=265537 RepID=A0A7S2Y259_9STRA|mmetsp:Transcript_11008/g.22542  ORF Transcript_11008/g.22542 Transcript_11008/m.22542 type:complete len:208 (+) Transcript_11008:166-789(+)